MASQSHSETLPISAVFSKLFRNFHRLMLTNLLFAVPIAAFTALFYWISQLLPVTEEQARLVLLLALIPIFPFYAGVVKVTIKIASGEEKTPVFRSFISGVRENFLRFLVHGAVLYVAVVFSYVSFNIYLKLISANAIFMGPLIITILIMLLLLFMFFYLPAMTVTFDIPMRYIYKNSFLMSYGELKKNFTALLGLFFLTVISMTLLIACYGSRIAVVIVTVLLLALFVPAIAAFIIHAAIYERMYAMITDKSTQTQAVNEKIRAQTKPDKTQTRAEFLAMVRGFELDESIPDDEYVYFNGKMVKKSVIKKLKAEAAEGGES